ncbi:MAG: ABC transporter permease [Magnetococcales bacterium]|nr:ABC transporter permease [Magnetococcales bacterium]
MKRSKRHVKPVWWTLGVLAFRRSFRCRKFDCDSGGRDFAWLTLLLALVISLALLLVGSRAGFLDRLTDSLLGTLRPYGVPIWVTPHWENHEGIQRDLLNRLRAQSSTSTVADALSSQEEGVHFTAHPYRRLADNSPRIQLPGASIWGSAPPFVGWAVYPDDPLWKLKDGEAHHTSSSLWDSWHTVRSLLDRYDLSQHLGLDPLPDRTADHHTRGNWLDMPLTLVANESLFASQFNYAAYRESLEPLLTAEQFARLPQKLWQNTLSSLDTLWLRITLSNEERLVPFKVQWVSHIPAMEKVAYLFPLSTYHALLAAHHLPGLRFDPEKQAPANPKVMKILESASYPRTDAVAFAACVQNEVASTGLAGLPTIRDEVCPKPDFPSLELGLAQLNETGMRDNEIIISDPIRHDQDNWLWLPCNRLPKTDAVRGTLCPSWEMTASDPNPIIPWDVTGYGTSYAAVHVYASDPTTINRVIGTLLDLRTTEKQQALNIHPMYQDALNRFNLLSDMLATLVPVYATTFMLLLSALLFAQVGALIDHRRNHYGILLSHGFTWLGLYAKLLLQMLFATLAAGFVAVALFMPLLRYFLAKEFSKILGIYLELLPPGEGLEVLPLSWDTVLGTLLAVYCVVMVVTIFLANRMPLRPSTLPSDLLHGGSVAPYDST